MIWMFNVCEFLSLKSKLIILRSALNIRLLEEEILRSSFLVFVGFGIGVSEMNLTWEDNTRKRPVITSPDRVILRIIIFPLAGRDMPAFYRS